MITNICLLLEIFSIVFCLHYLYGEKVTLDIKTVSYLAIHMIILTTVNHYSLPQTYTLVTYPVIAAYCGIKFGFKIKPLVVNYILNIAITSSIQFIVLFIFYMIFRIQVIGTVGSLMVNGIAFIIVLAILPRCRLDKFSSFLQDKDRIYFVALCISVIAAGYCLVQYKKLDSVGLIQNAILFVSLIFICFLIYQLGKSKVKAKEIETELKMHRLYADSFQSMIDNIRMRQHEFNNHISTMKGFCYMYNTYEELVNAQADYYETVKGESRFNKLLKTGNPVIIGFLYGKFTEIEKLGIDLSFKISIKEFTIGMPAYKVVEVVGNLIKNAVEALEKVQDGEKKIFVLMVEYDNEFEIEVRNTSRYFAPDEIALFYKKGYSQKGENRGLGLYNMKSTCEEYGFYVSSICETIDNRNWITFRILKSEEAATRCVVESEL